MQKTLSTKMAIGLALLVTIWQMSQFYNMTTPIPFIMISNFWMPAITMVLLRNVYFKRVVASWLGILTISLVMAAWCDWNKVTWQSSYFLIATHCLLLILLVPYAQCYIQSARLRIRYDDYVYYLLSNMILGGIALFIATVVFFVSQFVAIVFFKGLEIESNSANVLLMSVGVFEICYNLTVILFKERHLSWLMTQLNKFSIFLQSTLTAIIIGFCLMYSPQVIIYYASLPIDQFGLLFLVIVSLGLLSLSIRHHGGQHQKWFAWLCWMNVFAVSWLMLFVVWGFRSGSEYYFWPLVRLFSAVLTVCLIGLIIAYVLAILCYRRQWFTKLPYLNGFAFISVAVLVFLMNSPVIDVFKLASQSLLNRVATGQSLISPDSKDDFDQLGMQGKEAWLTLLTLPAYRTFLAEEKLKDDETKNIEQNIVVGKTHVVLSKNSPAIDESWWYFGDGAYQNCHISEVFCLIMAKDMNQDGKLDVIFCSTGGDSWAVNCQIWQKKEQDWFEVSTQHFEDEIQTEQEHEVIWKKLVQGDFGLKVKEWQDISITKP